MVYDRVYPYLKGGGEKRFFEVGKRLSQTHEVHFFGMKSWPNDFRKGNCFYHGCGKERESYNKKGKRKITQAILFSIYLFPQLMKNDFDVVDCSSFPYFSIFSAKIASTVKNRPLVVTWHEVWGNYWFEYIGALGFFGKFVEKIASKLPDKIIAVSEKTKKGLIKLGVKPEKITVIPNGIDFEEIEVVVPAKKGFDVVFVGRLTKEKNAHLLIEAIGIAKKTNPNVSCAIIGNGPEFDSLKQLVSERKLEKNISLLGFLDSKEMFSIMKASKIFAFPSVREGFGIAVLEANACGLPALVCVHENNAATDLIEWNENGFIVEPDAEQIAKAIHSMNNKTWNKEKIKQKAKEFDWNKISQEIEKCYEGKK